MENKKIGYFASYLTSKSKEELKNWLNNFISKEDLFFAEINGKTEEGEVVDKAHITLFYGLDDKKMNTQDIEVLIQENPIPEYISVGSVKTFSTPISGSKILVLSIEDNEKIFHNLHNKIKVGFEYFSEEYKYKKYNPHITLAYVKESFDMSKLDIKLLPPLILEKLEYKTKK